jgi:hypothetical protein
VWHIALVRIPIQNLKAAAAAGIPTDIRRPRIKTILNQLFHHGTKINDDLTGLDLMHLLISEALERERERGSRR